MYWFGILGEEFKMPTMNATTSMVSSMGEVGSWFSIVIIVFLVAIFLGIFITALASFEQYAKTRKWLKWMINTIRYFGFGLLTLLTLILPVSIIYYFLSQAQKGNIAPLRITLYLIGGYAGICIIGWIGKKLVYDRVGKFEDKLKKKENKKNKDGDKNAN